MRTDIRFITIAGCCLSLSATAFAQTGVPKRQTAPMPSPTGPAPAATTACGDQRNHTGGRCFPDALATPTVSSTVLPEGSACKVQQATGNPIGGIIVKGGRCAVVAPPTGTPSLDPAGNAACAPGQPIKGVIVKGGSNGKAVDPTCTATTAKSISQPGVKRGATAKSISEQGVAATKSINEKGIK